MKRLRRGAWVLSIAGLAVIGCRDRSGSKGDEAHAAVKLTDVSGSLDAVRTSFNAHSRESRFLTLLSPT